ncbi:MAG: EamA family transporter [Clostridiales bacterium]|nr:EamA family transporter [Clostridiales bacterium]
MGNHALFLIAAGNPFSLRDIVTYLPASAMHVLFMILSYVGLRYIGLSVSSPVCNSSGAVAAVLCFVFLNETISGLQPLGVVLVCAGVFLKRKDNAERAAQGLTTDAKHSKSIIAIAFPCSTV